MTHRRIVAMIAAVGAVAAALTVGTTPAVAADAPGNWYHLTNGTTGGKADVSFAYGRADDEVHVGDWDGDGTDTLGVRRGNQYFLTNGTTGGQADLTFAYGRSSDVVLVGDWDGDGKDTLGVRRGNQYYLTNRAAGGQADLTFAYGRSTDVVLVGDWNGDGTDTLGVRRGSSYYLTNGTTGGQADLTFAYGKAADVVLVGDWNGDGQDTLGVRRSSNYYLTNGTTGGTADITFAYGRSTDVVLVGDWNGDSTDTLGVRRPAVIRATIPAMPIGKERVSYAVPGQVKRGLYKSMDFRWSDCGWETGNWLYDLVPTYNYGSGSDPGEPTYVELDVNADQFTQIAHQRWDGSWPTCGGWIEALPTDPVDIRTSGGNGSYRVGYDIMPGTYRLLSGGSYCAVQAVRDFRGWRYTNDSGAPQSVLAEWQFVGAEAGALFELKASYGGVSTRGFIFTERCSWERVTTVNSGSPTAAESSPNEHR
ncbi:hypothetical protein [Agromyces bracchium]|uniref:VCBS repeat-containing protein n=1 Tax=Agromyces bracchium TaxID=88376 RepID=A0A6I3MB69_9MICO|nr:hypothetical protein [Agromyces bracchium]MTH69227.1 hypothetical protein [Agromyces bracchium]